MLGCAKLQVVFDLTRLVEDTEKTFSLSYYHFVWQLGNIYSLYAFCTSGSIYMCKFSKQRKTLQQFVSTLKSLPTLIKLQLLKMQIFIATS